VNGAPTPRTSATKCGYLAKIENQARHFHDACHILGVPLGFGRSAYTGVGLPDRLYDLSKQLLDHALILDADPG
jgi:hypothetical protein